MCHLSVRTSPGTCNVCRAVTAIAYLCSYTMQSIYSDSLAAVFLVRSILDVGYFLVGKW